MVWIAYRKAYDLVPDVDSGDFGEGESGQKCGRIAEDEHDGLEDNVEFKWRGTW